MTDFFYTFVYTLSERGFDNHWNGKISEMQLLSCRTFKINMLYLKHPNESWSSGWFLWEHYLLHLCCKGIEFWECFQRCLENHFMTMQEDLFYHFSCTKNYFWQIMWPVSITKLSLLCCFLRTKPLEKFRRMCHRFWICRRECYEHT